MIDLKQNKKNNNKYESKKELIFYSIGTFNVFRFVLLSHILQGNDRSRLEIKRMKI